MLRAFSTYFQLANTAEQHHRIRRRRAYTQEVEVPRESLAEAFERLSVVPADELWRRLRKVSLELVLTAHPTEATRRTMLRAHVRIAGLLTRLDDPGSDRGRARRARGRARRGDHDLLAGRRGARASSPASATRSGTACGSSRRASSTPASGCCASTRRSPRACRRRSRSAAGSAATSTGTPRSARETILEALERARESALARYRAGRARARDRARAEPVARRRHAGAEGLDRARRARLPGRDRDAGADDDRRGLPAEALVHVVAARERRLLDARTSCSPTSP